MLQSGEASWYSSSFQGRLTANGERYDSGALTAAHRTLPLGSYVRVRSLATGKSVVVRINDRGPYVKGRIIDLSYGAAEALGLTEARSMRVQIER
jgi:rare lipoprotein A